MFVLVLCSGCLASLLLFLSELAITSSSSREVESPYECGFEPIGSSHIPFCIKFFLLAILYIVFDVEICFLVPGLYHSSLLLSFLLVLLTGLVFEYAYGGLSWVV